MDDLIRVHDKSFTVFIAAPTIQRRVQEMGAELAREFAGQHPLFVVVLKGAYIFAADLLRACPIEQEVTFVQFSSYVGTRSSGRVHRMLELRENIDERPVIIIEDIVDTGRTLSLFKEDVLARNPGSVHVVTLLHKPDAQQFNLVPDYVGFSIPNRFVVGYGLDYEEDGRHLPGIYQLKDDD